MQNLLFAAFLLASQAQNVVELRLVGIAWGGAEARAEVASMVGEKAGAAIEAANTPPQGLLSRQAPPSTSLSERASSSRR